MAITAKRLRSIENRLYKQIKTIDAQIISSQIEIPDNWLEFARKTKVRSSGKVCYFDPWKWQIELIQLMSERNVLAVKSRQCGLSELTILWLLFNAIHNPGYLAIIISKTQTDASLLAKRCRRSIESWGLKTTTNNVFDIELCDGGRLLFRAGENAGRGVESVCHVLIDEAAFSVSDVAAIIQSVAPAMAMVGDLARLYVISTPNGRSGWFYDQLTTGNSESFDIEKECENIANNPEIDPVKIWIDSHGWAKAIVHWRAVPKYAVNPNFLQDLKASKKLTDVQIQQEYQLSFKSSELNVFEYASVMAVVGGEFEKDKTDYSANYYAGLDVAWMGNDATVFIILKEIDGFFSVVHLYRKKKVTSEVNLYNISKIIEKYKPFKSIGIESNNGGNFYLESLQNMFVDQTFEKITTTEQSKINMINRLILAIESKVLAIPDSIIINELLNFRKTEDGKLQAASGSNDDCVMSLAFALQVSGFSRSNDGIFDDLNFDELVIN